MLRHNLTLGIDHPQGFVGVLTAELDDPTGYGRILHHADGSISGIVEQKDASPAQCEIREINTGFIAAPAAKLRHWVEALDNNNAQKVVRQKDKSQPRNGTRNAKTSNHPRSQDSNKPERGDAPVRKGDLQQPEREAGMPVRRPRVSTAGMKTATTAALLMKAETAAAAASLAAWMAVTPMRWARNAGALVLRCPLTQGMPWSSEIQPRALSPPPPPPWRSSASPFSR